MHMQSQETALNHKVTGNFDAPNPTANYAPKRAVSDAALRAAKPKDKNYKIAVGGGLYEYMHASSWLAMLRFDAIDFKKICCRLICNYNWFRSTESMAMTTAKINTDMQIVHVRVKSIRFKEFVGVNLPKSIRRIV